MFCRTQEYFCRVRLPSLTVSLFHQNPPSALLRSGRTRTEPSEFGSSSLSPTSDMVNSVYASLRKALITSTTLRLPVLNFLRRQQLVQIPDPNPQTNPSSCALPTGRQIFFRLPKRCLIINGQVPVKKASTPCRPICAQHVSRTVSLFE